MVNPGEDNRSVNQAQDHALTAGNTVFVTRFYPYPQKAGAWIYTAQMIALFAQMSRRVDVICAPQPGDKVPAPPDAVNGSPVHYHVIASGEASNLRYLVSLEPKAAIEFATHRNLADLRTLLQSSDADTIVVDHIGASWVLPVVRKYRAHANRSTRLIYVTHNEETSTRLSIAREAGFPACLAHYYDAQRIAWRDRRMLRQADLITANTGSDLNAYQSAGAGNGIVLPPIFTRQVSGARRIDTSLPRKIIVVGSFMWSAKLVNLRRFLEVAAPVLVASGVALHVVGRMRDVDREALSRRYRQVTIHGEVPSVEPFLADARLGLLIDSAGGGFKHSALTFGFARVPMAALRGTLPDGIGEENCIVADTLKGLAERACAAIDDTDRLNEMQTAVFQQAQPYLSDAENLRRLRAALRLG